VFPDTTPNPAAAQIAESIGMAAPPMKVIRWLNPPHNAPPVIRFGDGHIYVLDFTATWCEGCPSLYAPLTEISHNYTARGVHVMLVTGLAEVSMEYIQHRILEAHHVTLPIVMSDIGGSSTAFDQFNVATLPTVIIIDQRGIVRYRWVGGQVQESTAPSSAASAPHSLANRANH
jgi:thiol-disulfide isomerase/thioredoxin